MTNDGLASSQTLENLKLAFARESEANRRYLWFAELADVEGYPAVAALFRSTADVETGHALGLLEYLSEFGDPTTGQPIGDTADNVQAAIAGETEEYTELYPSFAKTARDEGFDEIAEWMESVGRAEESHASQFTEILKEIR